jgi:RNase P subunit p30
MSSSFRSRKRQRQEAALPPSHVYELMVPIPTEAASVQIPDFLRRLGSTGVTHVALVHTVYGMARLKQDEAELAIPDSLWQRPSTSPSATPSKNHQSRDNQHNARKQQGRLRDPPTHHPSRQAPVKVLRRLNAVLENLSDVAHYVKRNENNIGATRKPAILQGYDLVSVCPRSEGTFQSACKSATASDIIVLDYSIGRGQLPYRIRPIDIKAAIARNAVFEIPYAPAILNQKKRKGLIQTW